MSDKYPWKKDIWEKIWKVIEYEDQSVVSIFDFCDKS